MVLYIKVPLDYGVYFFAEYKYPWEHVFPQNFLLARQFPDISSFPGFSMHTVSVTYFNSAD